MDFYRPRTYVRREVMFSQVCVCSGGGPRSQIFGGGVLGLRFSGGGPRSQIFWGGPRSQIFRGGPRSQIFGGVLGLSKGKNFWHQIWLDTCSDWKKIFCRGTPPPVKGKIFDTRFGLIYVQTGKNKFFWGTPSPPPVKGKIFDTRFGLIHVQTGKNFFCQGTPPE